MVVANASNAAVVSDALAERLAGTRAVLDDHSLATGLVAIQGPRCVDVLRPLTDVDLDGAALLRHRRRAGRRIPAQVARTGYTGEDGFEVFVDTARTGELWDALLPRSRRSMAVPVGLGARDTLRLEAGMPLYGNELDRDDDAVRRRASGASSSWTSRATSSVGRRSRRSPPTGPSGGSSASSSRAAGSPATATRSTPASGGPAS